MTRITGGKDRKKEKKTFVKLTFTGTVTLPADTFSIWDRYMHGRDVEECQFKATNAQECVEALALLAKEIQGDELDCLHELELVHMDAETWTIEITDVDP